LMLIGLGTSKQSKEEVMENVRLALASAAQISERHQALRLGVSIPEKLSWFLTAEQIGQSTSEGVTLGAYKFERHKKAPKKQAIKLKEVILLPVKNDDPAKLSRGLKRGESVASGVTMARDLINEVPIHQHPEHLVDAAREIAKKSDALKIKIFGKNELEKMGCGGILGVSAGSPHEPYLIHLIYQPKKQAQEKIALVGKGITFDSGGLHLKPADFMNNMKMDMAGAAAVLGIFEILSQGRVDLTQEIHGIIPTCENMTGPHAIKPGDILKMKNGKTVEIISPDAEGRIILGDAITYAREQKVDQIIDLATLTGACIAALGNDIAGLLSNNQKMTADLMAASHRAGEKLWPLPLEKSYEKNLISDVADLRNLSTIKGGGTITGALFIKQFVGKTPWAHLDIAGPAWAEKPLNAYTGKGGVGFGVRTVMEYLTLNTK